MSLDNLGTVAMPQPQAPLLKTVFLSFIAQAQACPDAKPDDLCVLRVQESCGTAAALARIVLHEVGRTCKDLFGDSRAMILAAAAELVRSTPITWSVDTSYIRTRLARWKEVPQVSSFATRLETRVTRVFPSETTAGRKGLNEHMRAVIWKVGGHVESSKRWYQEAERSFARALAEEDLTADLEFKYASCRLRDLVELDRHVEAYEFSRRRLRCDHRTPSENTVGDLLLGHALFGPRETYERLATLERAEEPGPMQLHVAWRELLLLRTFPMDLAGPAILDLHRRFPILGVFPPRT